MIWVNAFGAGGKEGFTELLIQPKRIGGSDPVVGRGLEPVYARPEEIISDRTIL